MKTIRYLACSFAILAICVAGTACSDEEPTEPSGGATPTDGGGDASPDEEPAPAPEDDGGAASCGGAEGS